MLITIKTDIFPNIYDFLDTNVFSSSVMEPRIITFIISLIFFVLSIMFLLSGVKSNKDKKAVSKHTNIGEVKISLNSIENIALNASKKANGVKETKAFVRKLEDSVAVIVRIIVMPDMNIPEISADIQSKVKNTVEDNAGIEVKEVKVIVEGIYSSTIKTRTELEVRR
jgi:Uncharacterized protein conserved in bacteria